MSLSRRSSRLDAGPQVLILLALAVAAAAFYPRFSLSHDASWYLTATARFLGGGRLYDDIVEINPPLAFYLTTPPVWAAQVFDINPTSAYFFYVSALALMSSLWTLALLRAAEVTPRQRNWMMIALAITLFVIPIAEFGQREHLMLILAAPFLLGQVLRPVLPKLGITHQVALGLAASLGLLLKPYFLLIPACIGLMRLFQERSVRPFTDPGMIALAAAAIAYVTFIVLVHPAYIEFIVPIARTVYASVGVGAAEVFLKFELLAAILLIVLGLRGNGGLHDAISQRFLAASIGAAACYLVQFKGWNYHVLPLSALLVLSAAWLAAGTGKNAGRESSTATIAVLIAVLIVGQQVVRGPYQSATTEAFAPFVKAQDRTVLVLSTNVWAAFPFVNEVSKNWASRFPHQWWIPGAYNCVANASSPRGKTDCREERIILEKARNAIFEDLLEYRPEVVFVDERSDKSYIDGTNFDYLEFLRGHEDFELFSSCYRYVDTRGSYSIFRLECDPPADAAQSGS